MEVNRPRELSFAGLNTFSRRPLVLEPDGLEGVDVAIVGAPFDETTVYRPGTRFGPRAIRIAGYAGNDRNMDTGSDPLFDQNVVDYGDISVTPGDTAASHTAIRETVLEIASAGVTPIILGGDHSIAHPDVGAVAEALAPKRVGLVHFDAHADDADELYGVRRSHGTPMRRLVEDGSILGENVVQVGLRGYWPSPAEFDWAREQGFRWHLMDEVHERGIRPVTEDVIDALADLDHVFLSVDIDVCDPAFAPGTGTPEPGGMIARDLMWCVRELATKLPIAGMEVVEVSPPYDHAEITALLAHRVILEALSGMALRKTGSEPRPELDTRHRDAGA